MTTDLRDKTVEEHVAFLRAMANSMGFNDDLRMFTVRIEKLNAAADALAETEKQIAEKDAALARSVTILNDLVEVSKIACKFCLVGMPSEASGPLPQAIKFLASLPASAKHAAEIIRAAEEQEHKHMLRHKAWLQSDAKTFEDAREDFMLACLRTVEAVRAKKGEKG